MRITLEGTFIFLGILVVILFNVFDWDRIVMLFTLGVVVAGYYSYLEIS